MNFTQSFINECIKNNKSNLNDIISQAELEIKEIDTDLKKMENLRTRQINLRTMLRQLGSSKKKADPSVTEENDPQVIKAEESVLVYLRAMSSRNNFSVRDILDAAGQEDDSKIVLIAIKNLICRQILLRNPEGSLIRGSNWKD